MSLNPTQSIADILTDIRDGKYRIPNIQRGYEWDPERVTKLLDSVLQGYPFGAIMVWLPDKEIRKEIQSRPFIEHFDSQQDYVTQPPTAAERDAHLVLDGQQRLQSLLIGFYGSYDGKRVHFQVDYRPNDKDEMDYRFEFIRPADAATRPELVPLLEILPIAAEDRPAYARELANRICSKISNAEERAAAAAAKQAIIEKNIERFREHFIIAKALLLQEVNQRQSYSRVLEIFQRVNMGGMVLTKSDLMFCTLKLRVQDMEEKFVDAINGLNEAGRYEFSRDFLIKLFLVILGKKAEYEVAKLNDEAFVELLRSKFDLIHKCLGQLEAWLEDSARIKCARFLRSDNALIPLIDFMFLSGLGDKPEGDVSGAMLRYLYMSFFLRLFSRGGDAVLDKLHDELVVATKSYKDRFPEAPLRAYIESRSKKSWTLSSYFFDDDADLMLNIVDGGVLQREPNDATNHRTDLKLEVDHIFPRSKLIALGMADIADQVGNYRLVVRGINRKKLAKWPTDDTSFFGRGDEQVEPLYQKALQEVAGEGLSRGTFLGFRDERAKAIKLAVAMFLGIPLSAEQNS